MKLIGSGIFLLLIGLVLTFAWEGKIPYVDSDTLGYILIGVGILSIILGLVLRKRSGNTTTVYEEEPPQQNTTNY